MKRDAEIDLRILGKILQTFITRNEPKLTRYHNYYMGKQSISNKSASDASKPCNKVCVNYCMSAVNTYAGYLTGIDVQYNSKENIEAILDILNYNDCHSEDTQLLTNALIYGYGVEINYIDEDAKQRFTVLDSREAFPIYDDTLNKNLLYGVRLYSMRYADEDSDTYIVEVYDEKNVRRYRSSMGFSSFVLLEEKPHFFNQVPMTFFTLNEEEISVFDQIMSLNDAYNEIISGEVDSWDAFADAYLVLKGMTADKDDLKDMKQNRILIMDTDASAEYLTKNVSDTQVQDMLTTLNDQIHLVGMFPDFNDERFMAQSGVAMRYKLVGFENQASAIESRMRKALQKRIELITSVISLTEGESIWRDIDIVFTRNLPTNTDEIVNMVNSLRGLVSDETLLSQIPFIDNVAAELERLKAQKEANMALYTFDTTAHNEEADE